MEPSRSKNLSSYENLSLSASDKVEATNADLPSEIISLIFLELEDLKTLVSTTSLLNTGWKFSKIIEEHIHNAKNPDTIHKIVHCLDRIIKETRIPLEKVINVSVLSTAKFTEEDFEQLLSDAIQNQQPAAVLALVANPLLKAYSSEKLHELLLKCIENELDEPTLWVINHSSIDPSYEDNEYIEKACEKGLLKVVNTLLEKKEVSSTVDYNHLFHIARENGHSKIFEMIVKTGKVDDSINNNMFLELIECHYTEMAKALLQTGLINPAFNDQAAFKIASKMGNLELVKALIELNTQTPGLINPSAKDNFAIQAASRFGRYDVVNFLLSLEIVDPTADKNSALKGAIAWGDLSVIQLLLSDERVKKLAIEQGIDVEKYLNMKPSS